MPRQDESTVETSLKPRKPTVETNLKPRSGISISFKALIHRFRPGKRIFLSYRRADTQEIAGRLYQRLSRQFGATNVFLDQEDIQHGQRWFDELVREIDKADVVLALIGANWIDI